jgi:hypothetical protein
LRRKPTLFFRRAADCRVGNRRKDPHFHLHFADIENP